jgi:multidrug efflux pump subunit AcrA (membrane-fusion protein)
MKRVIWAMVVSIGAVAGMAQAQGQPAGAAQQASPIIEAYTKPYKKFPVHFKQMGKINVVKVKEGDVVKKDDVLMEQDMTQEKAELAIYKFDAENRYPIEGAELKHKLAQLEFKAKERLYQNDKGRELEYERAKAEMDVAAVQIKQAETELEQKKLKYQQQQTVVDNMTLKADSEGVVQELLNDLGSTVDPTKPSLVIVQNNPLVVVVHLPGMGTLQLKNGEAIRVSYDRKTWMDAKVSYLSPEANAMTRQGLRTVHLELPNPDGVPAGLPVYVEVPPKVMAGQNGNAGVAANAR